MTAGFTRTYQVIAGAVLLLLVLGVLVKRIRDDGIRDERARQEAQAQADKDAQASRERAAEETRRSAEQTSRAAAEQRQKEIDHATRNIPDQAPSARQRSRACLELRRQAAADGGHQPAC